MGCLQLTHTSTSTWTEHIIFKEILSSQIYHYPTWSIFSICLSIILLQMRKGQQHSNISIFTLIGLNTSSQGSNYISNWKFSEAQTNIHSYWCLQTKWIKTCIYVVMYFCLVHITSCFDTDNNSVIIIFWDVYYIQYIVWYIKDAHLVSF